MNYVERPSAGWKDLKSIRARDWPIMLLFYPLCYAAVLLNFTYNAQEQELWSEYYALVVNNFRKTVLLECIYEWYLSISLRSRYQTMTVLLEYIDRLQFSIKA